MNADDEYVIEPSRRDEFFKDLYLVDNTARYEEKSPMYHWVQWGLDMNYIYVERKEVQPEYYNKNVADYTFRFTEEGKTYMDFLML